jgi:von Willebrand factor A domain-containing protein 8
VQLTIEATPERLCIGGVCVSLRPPSNPLLVPSIAFYNNPRQTRILRDMLRDWLLGML